jgi:hypothetical protein
MTFHIVISMRYKKTDNSNYVILLRIEAEELASLHYTFAQISASGMAEMPDGMVPVARA